MNGGDPEPCGRVVCGEIARLRAELAEKDEFIRQLSERLAAASQVLSRAAERRPDLFPKPEGD